MRQAVRKQGKMRREESTQHTGGTTMGKNATPKTKQSSNPVQMDPKAIECLGATHYDVKDGKVVPVEGVVFKNESYPHKGHSFIGDKPIYAEGHQAIRIVPKASYRQTCRCPACQAETRKSRMAAKRKLRKADPVKLQQKITAIDDILEQFKDKLTTAQRAQLNEDKAKIRQELDNLSTK